MSPDVGRDAAAADQLAAYFDSVEAVKVRRGASPWREQIAITSELRSVLLRLAPGAVTRPHYHTLAGELFFIVEGSADVEIGEGPPKTAHAGHVVFAPRGQRHTLRVLGDRELLVLCFLASNQPGDSVQCD